MLDVTALIYRQGVGEQTGAAHRPPLFRYDIRHVRRLCRRRADVGWGLGRAVEGGENLRGVAHEAKSWGKCTQSRTYGSRGALSAHYILGENQRIAVLPGGGPSIPRRYWSRCRRGRWSLCRGGATAGRGRCRRSMWQRDPARASTEPAEWPWPRPGRDESVLGETARGGGYPRSPDRPSLSLAKRLRQPVAEFANAPWPSSPARRDREVLPSPSPAARRAYMALPRVPRPLVWR
jgi:hypothetical protein